MRRKAMSANSELQVSVSIPANGDLSLINSILELLEASKVIVQIENAPVKPASAPSNDPSVGALRFAAIPGL
jgi:hypothetical protein